MTNNDVRSKARTKPLAIAVAASMLLAGASAASAAPAVTAQGPAVPAEAGALTNTAHLDFLLPPRAARKPSVAWRPRPWSRWTSTPCFKR